MVIIGENQDTSIEIIIRRNSIEIETTMGVTMEILQIQTPLKLMILKI